MADASEEFEPLFDYKRVQPFNVVCLDDDEDHDVPQPKDLEKKRKKVADSAVNKVGKPEDAKVISIDEEEDWLPPPPKLPTASLKTTGEDSTLRELRLKKQELLLFTQSAKDILRDAEDSVRTGVEDSSQGSLEADSKITPNPTSERAKIVISVQDKEGLKQFRMFMDDSFERLVNVYADKFKVDRGSLVFMFDGDRVNPSETPTSIGMEDEDIIEVHVKSL